MTGTRYILVVPAQLLFGVMVVAPNGAGAQWTTTGGARLGMSVQRQMHGDMLDATTTTIRQVNGSDSETIDTERLRLEYQNAVSATAWIPAGTSWTGQLGVGYSWGTATASASERTHPVGAPGTGTSSSATSSGDATRWRADASIGRLLPFALPRDTRVEIAGAMSLAWWKLELPGEPQSNPAPGDPGISRPLHVLRHTSIGAAANLRLAFPIAGPILLVAHAATGGDFTDRGSLRNSLRPLGADFQGESASHTGRWRTEHELGIGLSITWRGADPRRGTAEPRER